MNFLKELAVHEYDLQKIYYMLLTDIKAHIPLNESIDKLRWKKSIMEQNIMKETCRIGAESINAMFRECRTMNNESHVNKLCYFHYNLFFFIFRLLGFLNINVDGEEQLV